MEPTYNPDANLEQEQASGIERYLAAVQELQTRVMNDQRPALEQAAAQMAATIQAGGRIFLFGTGHSHMMAEEGFYRAGGLAAVVPILMGGLMLHENAFLSGKLERLPGLAGPLLEQFHPQPGEMLFVFSNSGVNHMPVEMVQLGKRAGLFVVAVESVAYARQAPLSAIGKRMDELADLTIDNCGQPGDALLPLPGSGWRVAASSTAVGALIWNSLVAGTAFRLEALGVDLPVFTSFNMPGAAEHNQRVLETWGPRNPYLKGWLPDA